MPSTATSSRADGNQLTVKGAFAVRRDRVARLHRTVLVNVGAEHEGAEDRRARAPCSTRARCRSVNTSSRSARSTEPATDTTPATFDATNGRVRMLPTHLHGAVNAVVPGQLNLDLRGIDRLGIDLFDFAGTGVTAGAGRESGRLRSRDRHAWARERRRRRSGASRRLRAAVRQRAGRLRRPHRRRLSRAAGAARHRLGQLGHDGAVLEHGRDRARARHRQPEHRRAPRVARRHAAGRPARRCPRRRRSRRRRPGARSTASR